MAYVYLASPYSDPDPDVMERRYIAVREQTASLIGIGLVVFSPIVHCHELAKAHNLLKDFNSWQNYCIGMLKPATELYILKLKGWNTSRGVLAELEYAEHVGIPISYVL
jgi:hypothetical protein